MLSRFCLPGEPNLKFPWALSALDPWRVVISPILGDGRWPIRCAPMWHRFKSSIKSRIFRITCLSSTALWSLEKWEKCDAIRWFFISSGFEETLADWALLHVPWCWIHALLMRFRMTQNLILPDCPSSGMVGVTDHVKCTISLSGNCPRFTPARLTPRSFNSGWIWMWK